MFTKLSNLLTDLKNALPNFTVTLFNTSPEIKSNLLMLGMNSTKEESTAWGLAKKRSVLNVVFSQRTDLTNLQSIDSTIETITTVFKQHFDLLEVTTMDFYFYSAQKVLFVYIEYTGVWI